MPPDSEKLRARRKPAGGSGTPLVLDFDDNRLLTQLFGEHDRNLARIERELDVSVVPRGNRVAISGAPASRDAARTVLSDLYRKLKQGLDIGTGDVDGAIRMANGNGASGSSMLQTRKRPIAARSPTQAVYMEALQQSELVFGLGPAGTGKTYLAVAVAVSMLLGGKVDRIILSRPAVEAGERLGFLPGDMREKVDPYLRPIYDALYDLMDARIVERALQTTEIEIAPLAFMRGRTLANAAIILDEAQNTTAMQMKMLLTRLGENSRMMVTGDPSQVDLPPGQTSGLADAVRLLENVEGIGHVAFTAADVIRHELVARIVNAYDKAAARKRERP